MLMRAIALGVFCVVCATAARADDLRIGGTGSTAALFEILGARFAAATPGHRVEVIRGLGSSGGIAATAEGAIDLSLSSRPLKPEERRLGVVDAPALDTPFVFVTSHARPQSLARAAIAAIYDGRMKNWPDGGEIRPILRPRSDSVSSWQTQNLPGVATAIETLRARPEVPVAATDHDNIQLAEAVPNSLAAATLMQMLAERPRLRLVAFDEVEPTLAAMQSGVWRDVLRIWLVTPQTQSAATRRFLAWLRTPAAQAILRQYGVVSVDPAARAARAD